MRFKYVLAVFLFLLVFAQVFLDLGANANEDEIFERDIYEISELINDAEAGDEELLLVIEDPQFIYVDGGKIDVFSGKFYSDKD